MSETTAEDGTTNMAYSAIMATGKCPIAYTEADTDLTTAEAYSYDPNEDDDVKTFSITSTAGGGMVINTEETAPGSGYSVSGGETGAATYTTMTGSGATSYASGASIADGNGTTTSSSKSTSDAVTDGNMSSSISTSTSSGKAQTTTKTLSTTGTAGASSESIGSVAASDAYSGNLIADIDETV
jgi:hypothetical protein